MITLGNILLHLAWATFWMLVGSYVFSLPELRKLVGMIREARDEGFEAGLALGMEVTQAVIERKDEEHSKGVDVFSVN